MIDFIYSLGLRIRAEKKIDNFYLLYVWEDDWEAQRCQTCAWGSCHLRRRLLGGRSRVERHRPTARERRHNGEQKDL